MHRENCGDPAAGSHDHRALLQSPVGGVGAPAFGGTDPAREPSRSPPTVPNPSPPPSGSVTQIQVVSPSLFEPGDVIGRADGSRSFRVLEVLGRGGQGYTFRCRDEQLGVSVVIKVPRTDGSPEQQAKQRTRHLEEARLLAQVSEATVRVPKVYDYFEAPQRGGHAVVVMQDVRGVPLSELISQPTFSLEHALNVCEHVADALSAAHAFSREMIHRDVKPQNILVDDARGGWLIDFGYARFVEPGSEDEKTRPTAAGRQPMTAGYASPEQEIGAALDASTDVFSFGCVLYECITRRRAFPNHRTVFDGDTAQIDELAYPIGAPESVRHLVKSCLLFLRTNRPGMREVHRQLKWALRDLSASRPQSPRESRTHNLPRPDGLFRGREERVSFLVSTLSGSEIPLMTLSGFGGVGKSALAVEAAHRLRGRFPHGVWLVDLRSARTAEDIAGALSEAMSRSAAAPGPDGRSTSAICRQIGSSALLLILDGCDGCIEACASVIGPLLDRCDGVRILATSQAYMTGLPEHPDVRLGPLEFPRPEQSFASAEQLLSFGAVQLFVRVAQLHSQIRFEHDHDLRTIGRITGLLNGLPLAIRHIASLVRCMNLGEIESSLRDAAEQFGPYDRVAEILKHTVMSAYSRLSRPEQELLQRLCIFEGRWTIPAAQFVCRDESSNGPSPDKADDTRLSEQRIQSLMISLSDKSMIESGASFDGGATRFTMLGPVRREVQLRYSADEPLRDRLSERLLEWCIRAATRAEEKLDGAAQASLLGELNEDRANIAASLAYARRHPARHERGLALAYAMRQYWFVRGQAAEGLAWLDAFRASSDSGAVDWRAKLANAAGVLSERIGDLPRARKEYEAALSMQRAQGNTRGVALVLNNLSTIAGMLGDWETCDRCYRESRTIRGELGDAFGVACLDLNYSRYLIEREHFAMASALLTPLRGQFPPGTVRLAMLYNNLAECLAWARRFDEADDAFQASYRIKHDLVDRSGEAKTLARRAKACADAARPQTAALTLGLALRRAAEAGESTEQLPQYAVLRARLRAELGEETFNSLLRKGGTSDDWPESPRANNSANQ
ncbi:MAG: protein kinase [Phycisphaerales bacterium]